MKSLRNKVSVVVATYNSGKEIEKTIKSFIGQDYINKELIIVDGGSNDETVEILKKYEKHIAYWISEPDKGISDAFNKGIKAAKGDYLYFIGAGDYFWSEDVLDKMMKNVDPEIDLLVCGKIKRVSEDGKKVLYTSSLDFKKWMLLYKMGLPHQALFTNRKFFDKYGLFDVNCKYAMDYELLLRSYSSFPKLIMKDVVVAAWRAGGVGKNRIYEVLDEYHRIRLNNKIAPKIILIIVNLLSKFKYSFDKLFEHEQ